MGRTEEVEGVLCGALDTVIQHGVVLIYGEYGVIWEESQNTWVWDRAIFSQIPHCCIVGAYMITAQPAGGNGDIFDTLVKALHLDPVWLRDLLNGFDHSYYQGAGYPDAFALGVRLREKYRPLCFEYLILGEESGLKISKQYEQYLQEHCIPERDPSFVPPPLPPPMESFKDALVLEEPVAEEEVETCTDEDDVESDGDDEDSDESW
jgi:hypothetical protein